MQVVIVVIMIIIRPDLVITTEGISCVAHPIHANVHHHHFCNKKQRLNLVIDAQKYSVYLCYFYIAIHVCSLI